MNQNPEQKARDQIDIMLKNAGWIVQDKKNIDHSVGKGIAIREYQTEIGPADYVLFVNRKPCGVIEAKKEEEGHRLSIHEEQSNNYAKSKLKYVSDNQPLAFVYESTGVVTRFTDCRDPKPRARMIFNFHRPETLGKWMKEKDSLRARLHLLPELEKEGLRDCQINAIEKLEISFKENKPRALIQMATGSGKTFTAITFIYRLLRYAKGKRVLFLVDTKNLGEQAEQEFMTYTPNDYNKKFTESFPVQRLSSKYLSDDNLVYISTIQRMYSILKGEDLDEDIEDINPNEYDYKGEPKEVVYNGKLPIEFFDFIVIDECHRSIYNLWKQVLEYFDAFLIGLTATPDKRTFGFFNENVVSEYSHEDAVADGVNVGFDTYLIETEITQMGSELKAKEHIERREKLSKRRRWEQLDEDVTYASSQLDKDVVNPSQIRNIIKAFKYALSKEIFPERKEVPKTLIFAKTDSHAEDIIEIVREEFGEGNEFCKKITHKSDQDPKSLLASFRNDYNPRIAVTVDMIATGTDVKPLECLLFMRDVRSKNYFEQMKGRGTRVIGYDALQKVTPSAQSKTHFVIIDAVGVTKSIKTDSRPLERKRTTSLKDLLYSVTMGDTSEDTFLSLASRLSRLEQEMNDEEKNEFKKLAKEKPINQVIRDLLDTHNPDKIEEKAREEFEIKEYDLPNEPQMDEAKEILADIAMNNFNGKLNEFILNVRTMKDQIIDNLNLDKVNFSGWDTNKKEKAEEVVQSFKEFIEQNKDEITALKLFYNQSFSRRELTYKMVKELLEFVKKNKPIFAPEYVWQAYEQIEKVDDRSPKNELVALVSLIRKVSGIDSNLISYEKVVNKNFQEWIFKKHSGSRNEFTTEQMEWLRMVKEHIASSFHMDIDDFDYSPFDSKGGLAKMYQLFGDKINSVIEELNEVLAA